MRMQLIFREGIGFTRSEADPCYETRPMRDDDPRQIMVVLGLVEAPVGAFQGEAAMDAVLGTSRRGLSVDLSSKPYSPDDLEYAAELDLGGVANSLRTRSPGGFGNLLAHGTFYLRETRFPASPGHVVFASVGIAVVGRGSVPERVMFDLEGAGSKFLQVSAEATPEAYEIGSALCQTYQKPIWGWDEPKRSIYSTLELGLIDDINRARALERTASRTSDEEDELAGLLKGPAGGVIGVSRKDEHFRRFKELAVEMGLSERISIPADSYPDAEALQDIDEATSEVVEALLDETRSSYAPGVR